MLFGGLLVTIYAVLTDSFFVGQFVIQKSDFLEIPKVTHNLSVEP
jgi:hypothetical protein